MNFLLANYAKGSESGFVFLRVASWKKTVTPSWVRPSCTIVEVAAPLRGSEPVTVMYPGRGFRIVREDTCSLRARFRKARFCI